MATRTRKPTKQPNTHTTQPLLLLPAPSPADALREEQSLGALIVDEDLIVAHVDNMEAPPPMWPTLISDEAKGRWLRAYGFTRYEVRFERARDVEDIPQRLYVWGRAMGEVQAYIDKRYHEDIEDDRITGMQGDEAYQQRYERGDVYARISTTAAPITLTSTQTA